MNILKTIAFGALAILMSVSCASSQAWIADPYSRYNPEDYICSVGYGDTMEKAELKAKQELASLFGMEVRASITRQITEASGSGMETSHSDLFASDFTASVNLENLYGVKIVKRGPADKGFAALAVMEKKPTAENYLNEINVLEKMLVAQKMLAGAADGTFAALHRAVQYMETCRKYNTNLMIYSFLSADRLPLYDISDAHHRYQAAKNAIVLEVHVSGDDSGVVKSSASKLFTDAGFKVSHGTLTPTAKVVVTIAWQDFAGIGNPFQYAQYNADVSVIDLAGNETVLVWNTADKEGHQTIEGARSRAVRRLCNDMEKEFTEALLKKYTIT